MEKPYFSVVIPTLNEEKYLPKLLKCLTLQTFRDFEVIVVDGHSDDQTREVALAFCPQLNLTVIDSPRRNVSYQRNLGAKNAQARIIVFLDADTKIPKNYLTKIHYAFATKNPDVLTTWLEVEDKSEKAQAMAVWSNFVFETAHFFGTAALYGAMMAVKKGPFTKVGGFKLKMKFGEDTDLTQRLVKRGYKYIILRNAQYVFSLRRFFHRGFWNTLKDTTYLNFQNIFKLQKVLKTLDYPMGGHVFAKIPEAKFKSPRAIKFFKQLFKELGVSGSRFRL